MRLLIPLFLVIFTYSCSATTNKEILDLTLPSSIDSNVRQAYNNGKAILLFGYSEKNSETEAYADWAGYLNDFKSRINNEFLIVRVNSKILPDIFRQQPEISEFSLFIKQGAPSYFYEGFIVESQVYTSVEHVYQGVQLTPEDKAFLPLEVSKKIKLKPIF